MTSHTPGAFEDQRRGLNSKSSKRGELEKVEFQDTRVPRGVMAVQSRLALDQDIQCLYRIADKEKVGAMKFQANGLLSFNRFMHLFIIVTRHSKE